MAVSRGFLVKSADIPPIEAKQHVNAFRARAYAMESGSVL